MKDFTIPEIRVFLAENLPYFESEDKDEFLYIAKYEDIEKLSKDLYNEFHNCEESANAPGAKPKIYCLGCGYTHEYGKCPDDSEKRR